ncbi:MAG TPA: HAD-IIB family hydrolase [Deltaproteobacteria bacterium]|nr:HAD-IIB family hydrolase [Deltaproteobacteria bacterium]
MALNPTMRGRRMPIVFTDLDGSLMDHADYSIDGARHALEALRSKAVPLVVCTSKTRFELETVLVSISPESPFIVENGGGIFFPPACSEWIIPDARPVGRLRCVSLGAPYAFIRSFMDRVGKRFSARGFADMGVDEVSLLTGLDPEEARLARIREFSEPFVIERETDLSGLEAEAAASGLVITRGGRFYHLVGKDTDKGVAVRRVIKTVSHNLGRDIVSIAIGDSPNDFPMLEAVDIPVLIPHEDGSIEGVDLPGLVRATRPGSKGWNDAVMEILHTIEL